MQIKKYIDDIETICSTCTECDDACAGNAFKNCFMQELEVEEELHCFFTSLHPEPYKTPTQI